MIVSYTYPPTGRRCYVAGRRLHHGLAGALAVAAASYPARRSWGARCALLVGALAVADDWRDFPWRDGDNHA